MGTTDEPIPAAPRRRRDLARIPQGGVRDETNLTSSLLDETLTWYGLGVDVNLGRHWFASVDVETSNGGSDAVDQLYSSVTYRF